MLVNHIARWDPVREMDELNKRLSGWLALSPRRPDGQQENITVAQWVPLVDISEDDAEYVIKAELPEIKKEAVRVIVENGVLTISGERAFEKEEGTKRYHRVERSYGSFARSFAVPEDADAARVQAEFKDGLLTVHLAKNEKTKPQSIEVKVA